MASANGADLVTEARKFLGDEYVYGATGPKTFDCSGLTQYVYKQLGITIPRTSEEQFGVGTPVSQGNAIPGDLVFFGGQGYDGTPSSPGHVGIYIGDGQMINAPHTGAVVRINSVAGNVGFRHVSSVKGDSSSTTLAGIEAGLGVSTGASGGLFSFPSEIVDFFTNIDTWTANAYHGLTLFFKPSTYVRIGAGVFGFFFVVTGLFFLMREAKPV